jgi:hypothetical protein
MVSALYVRKDSIYKTLGVDCWDIDRDAKKWPGGNPVIAHPPCRAWGSLSHMANPREGEKQLAIHAVTAVRRYGGILEHPATSKLWIAAGLPKPGKNDEFGGYTITINQSWFGHKALKKTFLYIVGCSQKDCPPIPIKYDAIQYTIASKIKKKSGKRVKKEVTKAEREETPEALARWMIAVAERCRIDYYDKTFR